MNQVHWTVEFSIHKGKISEFKGLIKEISELVERSEPHTITYQFFLDEEKLRCIVLETYEDSQAGLHHLNGKGVKTILPKILQISDAIRFEVFGEPSKELSEELKKFNPTILRSLVGFTR